MLHGLTWSAVSHAACLPSVALQVHSEETILYTAQQYVDQLPQKDQSAVAQKPAPLIRCPHLSAFWLSVSVMSESAAKLVLFTQRTHVQKLLMMRLANRQQPVKKLQQLLKGAPESWWLKQRAHKPVDKVMLTWKLDVQELKAAAIRSAQPSALAENRPVNLFSQDVTPPFRGMSWKLWVQCEQGKTIGLYMKPNTSLPDLYSSCSFTLALPQIKDRASYRVPMLCSDVSCGTDDLFPQNMAGGWDDAAWKAAGLPLSRKLTLKLVVTGVAFI